MKITSMGMHGFCIGVLATSISGCAADTDQPTDEQSASVLVEAEEIAKVSAGGSEVSFFKYGSADDVVIEETSSIYAVETPMDQLWNQELTSREIFSALAPNEPVPEALVAAHAREAQTLGRASDEVRTFKLDLSRTVQKAVTPTQCSQMFDTPFNGNYNGWVNQVSYNNLTYAQGTCPMGCAIPITYPTNVALMGICNSSSSLTLNYETAYKLPTDAQFTATQRTAAPNTIKKHYGTKSGGYIYAITGKPSSSSIVYHLRSAIAFHK